MSPFFIYEYLYNMKKVLFEDISKMKSLITILEDYITVNDGGYDFIDSDKDSTKYDKINRALLDDINKAAKDAGLEVTITTASSGHSSKKSRHSSGNAVDIALINGKGSGGATNSSNGDSSFRKMGDKIVSKLESMGYKRNTESGNEKAVLWQTNLGGNHFNHIHVSNKGTSTTQDDDKSTTTDKKITPQLVPTEPEKVSDFQQMMNFVGQTVDPLVKAYTKTKSQLKGESIQEQEIKAGKFKATNPTQELIWEFDNGKVVDQISDCEDATTILFTFEDQRFYVEYCGVERSRKRIGDTLQLGDKLGNSTDKIIGTFFDATKKPVEKETPKELNPKQDLKTDPYSPEKYAIFRDEEGEIPNTSLQQLYQLSKNLNPLAARYAVDDKGNPVKVQQGLFGSTATDSGKLPKNMSYFDKIKMARTPDAAKKKGLKVVDTRPGGKGSKYLRPQYKIKEEIEIIKRLLK
jgi:hypothetical protein